MREYKTVIFTQFTTVVSKKTAKDKNILFTKGMCRGQICKVPLRVQFYQHTDFLLQKETFE